MEVREAISLLRKQTLQGIQDSHRFVVSSHWAQSTQLRVFFASGRGFCGSLGEQ